MKDNTLLSSKEFEQAKGYWLEQLAGEIPETTIYKDFSVPGEYQNANCPVALPRETAQKLITLSNNQHITLYVFLTAVLKILLFKYTDQTEIIIGAPVYTTTDEVYDYNQCIVLRDRLDDRMTFKELVLNLKQTIVNGIKNQHYPYKKILSFLEMGEKKVRLLRTILVLENIHKLDSIAEIIHSPENDLTLSFCKTEQGVEGKIFYHAGLFTDTTIHRFFNCYQYILQQVLDNSGIRLGEIELVHPEEKRQLTGFDEVEVQPRDNRLIHEIFEAQAAKTPDRIAVRYIGNAERAPVTEQEITYRELNQKANQLGMRLRESGITANKIVGLFVERSVEMAIGILGILKAGGAYLPIDPDYPDQRIEQLLTGSGVNVIVTQSRLLSRLPSEMKTVTMEDDPWDGYPGTNPPKINASSDLAYVIYTSGSSGQPKGVMIEHHSLVNFINWRIKQYEFCPEDITLQLIGVAFDGFGTNFYASLLSGGQLLFPDENRWKDFQYIKEIIRHYRVTNMSVVPPMYGAILENAAPEDLRSLRFVVLAAEKPGSGLLKLHDSKGLGTLLINEYGPTETTITTTVLMGIIAENVSVIGAPIANNRIYILNKNQQLMPVGVPGEIWVGGAGVARGYLHDEILTAAKFGPDPFHGGSRVYQTGDLGRWLPDGNIEFLGRMDGQVKIMGYRIELGEVETHLLRYERVKEAVVVTKEDRNGDRSLYAYFTSDRELSTSELRSYLGQTLPDYMIPYYFVQLPQMPLTPNGKIDRKALLRLEESHSAQVPYEAPRNEIETRLAAMWEEALGVSRVGIHDNFFQLGGHSLKATILTLQIQKVFEVEVTLWEIFDHQTLAQIATIIADRLEERRKLLAIVQEIEQAGKV